MLKVENQYPKGEKERNCLERLSNIISPDPGLLVLAAQLFRYWLQQVDFSFCAEA